jgi:hypothetical protein
MAYMSYVLPLCCSWFDPAWLSLSAVFAPRLTLVPRAVWSWQPPPSFQRISTEHQGWSEKQIRGNTEQCTLKQCIIDPSGGSFPYTFKYLEPPEIAEITQLTCMSSLVQTVSRKAVRWGFGGLVGPIITAVCVDAKHQVTVDYSSTLKLGD